MARPGVNNDSNYGDEYEGAIALFDLAQTINTDDFSGRVIIVPGMNYPAFQAGTRTSPIDGGNMNRISPVAQLALLLKK